MTDDDKKKMEPQAPCRIAEYDGAYKCFAHNRVWGAITNPDTPCEGWQDASIIRLSA